SGAEANEKAFALCLSHAHTRQKKILAFEGSFHERTMLSLHSTWNPVKRAPFELPGYATTFAPYPLWSAPNEGEPTSPEGWLRAVGAGDMADLEGLHAATGDALLAAELDSLRRVHEVLE